MLCIIGVHGETRKFVCTIICIKSHCIAYKTILLIASVTVDSKSRIITKNRLSFVGSESRHQKRVIDLSQGVIADTAAKYIQRHYELFE